MRLWHYKLLPYLPNSQLVAQWRELCSIFRKRDNHILINYVYEYPDSELMGYAELTLWEMKQRGFKVDLSSTSTYRLWLCSHIGIGLDAAYGITLPDKVFERYHTNRYLKQCFYNLQEKYDRGQKDFSEDQYNRLENFVKQELGEI